MEFSAGKTAVEKIDQGGKESSEEESVGQGLEKGDGEETTGSLGE